MTGERPEKQRALTVRFDAVSYELVRSEADHAGVSVAQFIREATLMRAVVRAAHRDAPGMPRDFVALAYQLEELARLRRYRR